MPEKAAPIIIQEYERITTDQLTPAQAVQLRDHFSAYLKVERTFDGGSWLLTARQHVGVILLDNVQIHIQPKVPLDNLFYMLTYAYDLARFRDEQTALTQADDLFAFIVRIFAGQVAGLARRGLHRGYREFVADARYLRGRLLLGPHLRRSAVNAARFVQRETEFTADLLENQILAYTVWRLTHVDWRDEGLRQRLHRLSRAFHGIQLRPIQPLDCAAVTYTRLNDHYQQPIHLARLLLAHLSLEGKAGAHPFAAFLIDMNQLFERFVAYYLQDHFAADPDVTVTVQHQIWLDEEERERGEPDIVLQRANRPVQVLDTKYKPFEGSPKQSDIYQMYAYGQTLGLPAGALIYPEAAANGYRPVQMKGMRLETMGLDLSGELAVFKARCRAFAQAISL